MRMLLLLPALCLAQAATDYEIVVTGDRNLEETSTATVSVIKREFFEGRNVTVSQVIDQEAGLDVKQTGGLGDYSSVSIRGSTSEQVKVLLDGVPVSTLAGTSVDLSRISIDQVDRIEVFKGTLPPEFQGNGTAGVINIVSRRTGTPSFTAQTTAGSFGTRKAGAALSGSRGPWDLLLSGDYRHSDNDYEWLDDRGTTLGRLLDPTLDDTVRRMENNDYSAVTFFGKAAYASEGPLRLRFSGRFQSDDKGWFYTKAMPPYQTRVNGLEADLQTEAQYRRREMTLLAKGALGTTVRRLRDPSASLFYIPWDVTDTTRSVEGSLSVKYHPEGPAVACVIIRGRRESFLEKNQYADYSPSRPDALRYSGGATVTGDLALLSGRLGITSSYTADWKGTHVDFTGTPRLWRSVTDGYRQALYHNGNLGANWAVSGRVRLKINSGIYSRVPSVYELFGDNAFSVGNPDLLPEKGWNSDLGFLFSAPLPFRARASGTVSCFYNRMTDQIVYVNYANHIIKPENQGDAWVAGVENTLRLSWNAFSVSDEFTFMHSRIFAATETGAAYVGHELASLPAFKNALEVSVLAARFAEAAYGLEGRSGYYKSAYNRAFVPGALTHHVRVKLVLWDRRATLTGEVNNLLDRKEYDVEAFPLPGRAYYATLACNLQPFKKWSVQ